MGRKIHNNSRYLKTGKTVKMKLKICASISVYKPFTRCSRNEYNHTMGPRTGESQKGWRFKYIKQLEFSKNYVHNDPYLDIYPS